MNKIRSRIKYYSFIIFPILTFLACILINIYTKIFELDNIKVSSLISVSATFIGALLTVLTIYLAVPKSTKKVKQLKESYHEHIYLTNILAGIIIYLFSIIIWLFFDISSISSMLFISGLINIIISIYYTFSLIKLM